MIRVIASVALKQQYVAEYMAGFKANVPKVLAEEGCAEYFAAVDIESGLPPQTMDENTVTIIEQWESLDALRAHLESIHMKDFMKKTDHMVESLSLKVLRPA
jgi:quinol monooxygenase YgiN